MTDILAMVQQSGMQWFKPLSFAFGFNKVLMAD